MLIAVFEDYSVNKFKNVTEAIGYLSMYYTQGGNVINAKVLNQSLKDDGYLNAYDYDTEQVEEALENGYVLGQDWSLKITKV